MNELEFLPIPLLEWYRENARTLPWRSDPTPYRVLVSEIMLQQTRVAAVLDYFARFMDALPTVQDLAEVDEDRLMKLWQGLGYYNRARNLQRAARQIVGECAGIFPQSYEGLRTLSGVGEYTAGAVASIAFGVPVPAVDGNVLRVVARLTGDEGDVTKPGAKNRMRAALQEAMPRSNPGDFNQALMELGATVCLPNGAPLCEKCPGQTLCRARAEEKTGIIPVKTPKKERRVEERIVYLLFRGREVALRRRPSKGLLAGLWEYPNELAAVKGLPEAWGICPRGPVHGPVAKHIFTHIEWRMTAYLADLGNESLPPGWVWADGAAMLRDYALPNAFQGFRRLVEGRIGPIHHTKEK